MGLLNNPSIFFEMWSLQDPYGSLKLKERHDEKPTQKTNIEPTKEERTMEIAVLGNGRLANKVLKQVMTEYYTWAVTIGPDGSTPTNPGMYA